MDFNFGELFDVTIRALMSLLTLFLVTKVIGKRQVSQLSIFDYVIGISIGNFAAEMTTNLETNELNGILAVIIFGFIAYIVSYITLKCKWTRNFFTGKPTILIQEGKIVNNNLKKVRFDLEDLLEACRCGGYFDINDIYYAIMEVNGEISFLPKSDYKNIICKDLSLNIKQDSITKNIIMDGKIVPETLRDLNISEDFVRREMASKGYKISDLLLVTISKEGKYNIYEKELRDEIKEL